MTITEEQATTVVVAGDTFTRAWRNALDVADSYESYGNTVRVQVYEGRGIRLISTDSHILLTQWVSTGGDDPGIDAEPDLTASVLDLNGLGRRFKHIIEVRLTFGAGVAIIQAEGATVTLPLNEADYPDWRKLFPTSTTKLSELPVWLSPYHLRRVRDLRGLDAESGIDRWTRICFHRPTATRGEAMGPIQFVYRDIRGLLMPLRKPAAHS